jgi:hypothetical protein
MTVNLERKIRSDWIYIDAGVACSFMTTESYLDWIYGDVTSKEAAVNRR